MSATFNCILSTLDRTSLERAGAVGVKASTAVTKAVAVKAIENLADQIQPRTIFYPPPIEESQWFNARLIHSGFSANAIRELQTWAREPNAGHRLMAIFRILNCKETGAKELDLRDLGLTRFPKHMEELGKIAQIRLDGNRITSIDSLLTLNKNCVVYLLRNPLRAGWEAQYNYYAHPTIYTDASQDEIENQAKEYCARRTPLQNNDFKNMSYDLLGRMGMDRSCHEEGPNAFEIYEPGYQEGMKNGWQYAESIRNCRMNAQLFSKLRDGFVKGVKRTGLNEKVMGSTFKKGLSGGFRYNLFIENITSLYELTSEWESEKLLEFVNSELEFGNLYRAQEDLTCYGRARQSTIDPNEEHHSQIGKGDEEDRVGKVAAGQNMSNLTERGIAGRNYLATGLVMGDTNSIGISSNFKPGDENRIDEIFEKFYAEIETAKIMDVKYAAVGRCCRALLMFHPFADGNGRAVSFALRAILLYQIGSPPAMLNPTHPFDGSKTEAEMVTILKEGLDYFQRMRILTKIGEFTGHTPTAKDATDYKKLARFYEIFGKAILPKNRRMPIPLRH